MVDGKIKKIEDNILLFLDKHSIGDEFPYSGKFSLYRGANSPDLYGMIDFVYILFITGKIGSLTDRNSRERWAERILSCQDDRGWFSLQNLRGHSVEHATAYAIAALQLLALDENEDYLSLVKPLEEVKPLLTDDPLFFNWISRMGFRWSPTSLMNKRLGWHYIWQGSHIGGGVAASLGMLQHKIREWWPEVDLMDWFDKYIRWLNKKCNPETGYWQRAFWNILIKKPTIIDLGGAVHFYWIYDRLGVPFPYPESLIQSTLNLQKPDGLYKDHPFCIDLDANFCLIRALLSLPEGRQHEYRAKVYQSTEKNVTKILSILSGHSLEEVYEDSHGLPGALAALVECKHLPDFVYQEVLMDWQNPLDEVWWL
jgi:hypothetical protein